MTDKQVAPPFGVKQVSNPEPDTLTTLGDEPTVPVEGLSEAVDEHLASEASSDEPASEQMPELDVGGEAYWASGGMNIGGVQLGNRAPQAVTTSANPFKPAPPNPKNPFAQREVVKPVEKMALFEVPVGTPSWRDFVNFVLEHAKDIQKVRYPNAPRNEELIEQMRQLRTRQMRSDPSGAARPVGEEVVNVIDTIYKGIPVVNEGQCMIQHVRHGWASWEDCQS